MNPFGSSHTGRQLLRQGVHEKIGKDPRGGVGVSFRLSPHIIPYGRRGRCTVTVFLALTLYVTERSVQRKQDQSKGQRKMRKF